MPYIAQAMASSSVVLPAPFGPTMPVRPLPKSISVFSCCRKFTRRRRWMITARPHRRSRPAPPAPRHAQRIARDRSRRAARACRASRAPPRAGSAAGRARQRPSYGCAPAAAGRGGSAVPQPSTPGAACGSSSRATVRGTSNTTSRTICCDNAARNGIHAIGDRRIQLGGAESVGVEGRKVDDPAGMLDAVWRHVAGGHIHHEPALGVDAVRLFFRALAPDVRAGVLQGARVPLLACDLVSHVVVAPGDIIPAPGPDLLRRHDDAAILQRRTAGWQQVRRFRVNGQDVVSRRTAGPDFRWIRIEQRRVRHREYAEVQGREVEPPRLVDRDRDAEFLKEPEDASGFG